VALMLECCDESETDREDYSARRGTKVADEIHSLEQREEHVVRMLSAALSYKQRHDRIYMTRSASELAFDMTR
jgi:hypothetical protein